MTRMTAPARRRAALSPHLRYGFHMERGLRSLEHASDQIAFVTVS
jgi:hypothetical protein